MNEGDNREVKIGENVAEKIDDKPKESPFKDNPIIALLIVIIIAIIGYVIYTTFFQKPDNGNSSNNTSRNTSTPIPHASPTPTISNKIVYRTSDSKFKLELYELDNEKAKEDFEKIGIDPQIYQSTLKMYAYFNGTIFGIDEINEDENYATYRFIAYPNEDGGKKILVNKKTKRIELPKEMLKEKSSSCINNGFCGFVYNPSFVNTVLGYFFISDEAGLITLYTKDWKRLGYVNMDLSNDTYTIAGLDETGVTAYSEYVQKECSDLSCSYDLLNPSKYNAKGDLINE